jgi:hypothetical protein
MDRGLDGKTTPLAVTCPRSWRFRWELPGVAPVHSGSCRTMAIESLP